MIKSPPSTIFFRDEMYEFNMKSFNDFFMNTLFTLVY